VRMCGCADVRMCEVTLIAFHFESRLATFRSAYNFSYKSNYYICTGNSLSGSG
jgi:hypothetical protein